MDLPLFPLHTVLCPGVVLPLHLFEPRYREMVGRCLADDAPFGVVLIREGRETGPSIPDLASVGTLAEIREAASRSTSMSRTTSGPRVMIENGVHACASSTMQARVSRKRPSAGWYGSVAVPIATSSGTHDFLSSSRRRTSAMFG